VSWVERSGRIRPVHKCPATDPAKTSKAGVLDLIQVDGQYRTVERQGLEPHPASCLQTVFENGMLRRHCSLEEVRARAMQG
jgi:nicotinamide phosphoribosyltransferase